MPKFIMPNAPKGVHVLNDRYVFQDGVMQCKKSDAEQIARILCVYHGCTLEDNDEPVQAQNEPQDNSLAASVTKVDEASTEVKSDKKGK